MLLGPSPFGVQIDVVRAMGDPEPKRRDGCGADDSVGLEIPPTVGGKVRTFINKSCAVVMLGGRCERGGLMLVVGRPDIRD